MLLKETRKNYNLTIAEAALTCSIPYRTYLRYEKDEKYGNSLKRKALIDSLNEKYEITENKGLLTVDEIKEKCNEVFSELNGKVEFCFLFGSYAKGYANEESDVDLLVSTKITGFDFLSLIEKLRAKLNKKIDLLRLIDQQNNIELISEIMKDGIKIYE